ncbi:MAG: hypothetical protein MJ191_00010 [Clostridium sp.]|nr:hypothetical protein [Clostridium sp.]
MRNIQITDEVKQKAIEEFIAKLNNERTNNNSISVTMRLDDLKFKERVQVYFTPKAWLKMWSLVHTEPKEIGWHGTVQKIDKYNYIIKDILMYPQYTTGVTVQTDDVEYGNWLIKELDDDTLNSLRFHGHSHVNMATTPSGVDDAWYQQILDSLNKNDFYIFMIANKREEFFIEIYDLENNAIYEKKDIDIVALLDDDTSLQDWVATEKNKNIKQKQAAKKAPTKLEDLEDAWYMDDYAIGNQIAKSYNKKSKNKTERWSDYINNFYGGY